jgi:hypothetical protein
VPKSIHIPKKALADDHFEAIKASAAELKKPAISPEKLRAIIGGAAFGVVFAAQSLANRDADGDGIDDYFARKLNELALDMQAYAFTGKLPNGFAA